MTTLGRAGKLLLLFVAGYPDEPYARDMHGWILESRNSANLQAYSHCDADFARRFRAWLVSQRQSSAAASLLLDTLLKCGAGAAVPRECIGYPRDEGGAYSADDINKLHTSNGVVKQLGAECKKNTEQWDQLLHLVVEEARVGNRGQIFLALAMAWCPAATSVGLLADVLINTMFFYMPALPDKPTNDHQTRHGKIARRFDDMRRMQTLRPHVRGLFLWQLMSDMANTNVSGTKLPVVPFLLRDRPDLFGRLHRWQTNTRGYHSLLNESGRMFDYEAVASGAQTWTFYDDQKQGAISVHLAGPLDEKNFRMEMGKITLEFVDRRKGTWQQHTRQYDARRLVAKWCDIALRNFARCIPQATAQDVKRLPEMVQAAAVNKVATFLTSGVVFNLLADLVKMGGPASVNLGDLLRSPGGPLALSIARHFPDYIASPIGTEMMSIPDPEHGDLPFDNNYAEHRSVGGPWTRFAQPLATRKCTPPLLKLIVGSERFNMYCGLLVLYPSRYFVPITHKNGAHLRVHYHLLLNPKKDETSLPPLRELEQINGGVTFATNSMRIVWSEEVTFDPLDQKQPYAFTDRRKMMMSFVCARLDAENEESPTAHFTLTRIGDLLRVHYESAFGEAYDGTLASQARLLRAYDGVGVTENSLGPKAVYIDHRVQEYLFEQHMMKGLKSIRANPAHLGSIQLVDDMLVANKEVLAEARKAADDIWNDKIVGGLKDIHIHMLVMLRKGMEVQNRQRKLGIRRQKEQAVRLKLQSQLGVDDPKELKEILKVRGEQYVAQIQQILKTEVKVDEKEARQILKMMVPEEAGALAATSRLDEMDIEEQQEDRRQRQKELAMRLKLQDALGVKTRKELVDLVNSGKHTDRIKSVMEKEFKAQEDDWEEMLGTLMRARELSGRETAEEQLESGQQKDATIEEKIRIQEQLIAKNRQEYSDVMDTKEDAKGATAERERLTQQSIRLERYLKKLKEALDTGSAVPMDVATDVTRPLLDFRAAIDAVCDTFGLFKEDISTREKILDALKKGKSYERRKRIVEDPENEAPAEWFEVSMRARFVAIRKALLAMKARPDAFSRLGVVEGKYVGRAKMTDDDDQKAAEAEMTNKEKEAAAQELPDLDDEYQPLFPALYGTFDAATGSPEDMLRKVPGMSNIEVDLMESKKQVVVLEDYTTELWARVMGVYPLAAANAWRLLLRVVESGDIKQWTTTPKDPDIALHRRHLETAFRVTSEWNLTESGYDATHKDQSDLKEVLISLLEMTDDQMPEGAGFLGREGVTAAGLIDYILEKEEEQDPDIMEAEQDRAAYRRAGDIVGLFEWCQWCHAIGAIFRTKKKRAGDDDHVRAGVLDYCVDAASSCLPRYRKIREALTGHLRAQALFQARRAPSSVEDFDFISPGPHTGITEGSAILTEARAGHAVYKKLVKDRAEKGWVDRVSKLWPMLNYTNNPRDFLDVLLLEKFQKEGKFRSPDVPFIWSPCREVSESTHYQFDGKNVPYVRWAHAAEFDLAEATRTEFRCIQMCHTAGKKDKMLVAWRARLWVSYVRLYRLTRGEVESKLVLDTCLSLHGMFPGALPELKQAEMDLWTQLVALGDNSAIVGWVYGNELEQDSKMVGHSIQNTQYGEQQLVALADISTSPAFARHLYPTAELYWYKTDFDDIAGIDAEVINEMFGSSGNPLGQLVAYTHVLRPHQRVLGDIRSLAILAGAVEQLDELESGFIEPFWRQLNSNKPLKALEAPKREIPEDVESEEEAEQEPMVDDVVVAPKAMDTTKGRVRMFQSR